MEREHLKLYDVLHGSKFNGKPSGFHQRNAQDKPIIDMDPEVFNMNFPIDAKVPLKSLDM